jgi:Fe-S cluster assembly protein SufD
MSHPHIIVRAARHSRCTLIEQYIGLADADMFTNSVSHIDLQDGARFQHYRVQQESRKAFHIGHANVCLHEHAQYHLHDLAFGGSLSRFNIAIYLQGVGAHAALNGLLVPTGAQHLDAHTRIEHVAPHTTSEEDYRGIADGRGRGVFNGKVLVHPDAQKTDARQSSRNLLLSPTAEIDAKPELEIYANDVKCSHGSTTGQLDAAALFYLRSRGISEQNARALLIRAFAETTISSVRDERVREYLEAILSERFGAAQVSP